MAMTLWAISVGLAAAQTTSAPAAQHLDVNMYPSIGGSGGVYDLQDTGSQKTLPPASIAVPSAPPVAAYSFADVLRNTHGYVSAGVSSRGGYGVEGGVSMPVVPGKVDLDLAVGTGQIAGLPTLTPNGKHATLTYDEYSAGLHLHPADDFDAYIGVSGLRLHGNNVSPFASGFP
jgi:hypothetical protein